MESILLPEDYNKLIDSILQKYIDSSVDTKRKIIYKVEYNKEDTLDEFEPYSEESQDGFESDSEKGGIAEPYYKVVSHEVSIRVYIKKFNQMYGYEFDKWLISQIMGDSKKDCIIELIIDENELEKDNNKYLNNIISQIRTSISESCYPFVIFIIRLKFKNSIITHLNTLIIHYSKDYSNILMIYYEPHGSVTSIIHEKINIHKILDYIKNNYTMTNGKKAKVQLLWGVEKIGIQDKDTIGLCKIFTRFWTFIILQLLKICKDNHNSCVFNEELLRSGEHLLQEKVKKQFPDEKDKDYDVIISWMYIMIYKFLGENTGNGLINVNKELIKIFDDPDSNALIIDEYGIIDDEWPAQRFYTEFNQDLNIPKPNSVKKREEYINKVINTVHDLPLEKQSRILKELIKRNMESIERNNISTKEQELMLNEEEAKNHVEEIKDNLKELKEKLSGLIYHQKIYKKEIEKVEEKIKKEKEEQEILSSNWRNSGLDEHNNNIQINRLKRKPDNSFDKYHNGNSLNNIFY
jgi:hypothetical protein